MKCIHCGGKYEASVANARLCHDCADKTFSIGFDEDGVPVHILFDGDGTVFRPDGTKAKSVSV